MAGQGRDNALDHMVVVVFENRSLDNVLGRLYGPQDGKTFEGVIGKDLTNPIPEWAEHGADRKVVPYTVATDVDSPNPDTGEEYPHTHTQQYGILSEELDKGKGKEVEKEEEVPQSPPSRRSTFSDGDEWPLEIGDAFYSKEQLSDMITHMMKEIRQKEVKVRAILDVWLTSGPNSRHVQELFDGI